MSDHARFSPSAAHRWMNCPGSLLASETVENTTSPQAERGTRLHEIAAGILQGSKTDFGMEAEDLRIVNEYISYVLNIHEQHVTSSLFVERKVQLTSDIWGTADAIVVQPYVVHIIDLKTGSQQVDAFDNPQLMIYAAAVLSEFNVLPSDFHSDKPPVEVVMHIAQPSLNHFDSHAMPSAELTKYANKVIKASQAALCADAKFVPSENNCKFCPVRSNCKARSDFNVQVAVHDFKLADPYTLSDFDLKAILPHLAQIEQWTSDIRKFAISRLLAGGKVEGFKLVRTGGARKWKDNIEAVKALIDAGVPAGTASKIVPMGIGDAEKLIGKKHPIFESMTVRADYSPALTVQDDKRAPWNGAGDFPALES